MKYRRMPKTKDQIIKVAINGFGRIGRAGFKLALEDPRLRQGYGRQANLKVVAINDLTDIKTLAHLLKHDSVYGIYNKDVKNDKKNLIVDKIKYPVYSMTEPAKLPWKKLNVDVVLECTGKFVKDGAAKAHLKAGAKKVILSAPAKGKGKVPTYLIGVNEDKYQSENLISMASCATNCYAPLTKILHDKFGVERGYMVTTHAVTNDQRVLDFSHKDLRRARSVLDNIIPTTSGSNKATTEVIPELKGKLHTMAMRVPVRVGSVIYAVYDLKKRPSSNEVNKVIKSAVQKKYKNIIKYEINPIVSSDVVGTTYSAIFDSLLTEDSDDLIKIVAWYDNEWAYSKRLVEMVEVVMGK